MGKSTVTRTGFATLSGYKGLVCSCGRVSRSRRAYMEHVLTLPVSWRSIHRLVTPKAEARV